MNQHANQKYLHSTFLVLLLIGSLIRIFGFWEWSLTNDELSALNRLQYNSVIELFSEGIWVDGHPAFVQLFLYFWTMLFGESVFALRLPFVLAGIGSIYYFYQFGKNWLNLEASLIATSLFITSQLLVLYSQMSRPYVMGVFFLMAFAFYWNKLCQQQAKRKEIIAFIIFGLLATITHYFSALSVLLMLPFGILMVTKSERKKYILASISIGLLYLPHLPITLNHISIGGIGWLAAPESEFHWRFLNFSFNNSILFQLSLIAIILHAILSKKINLPWKKQLILLILSISPYAIAWYYSEKYSPILQFSILSFSLPFLLLFLASIIKEGMEKKHLFILLAILLTTGSYSLIAERNFYSKKKFANFKGVAAASVELANQYGMENILSISNANDTSYLDYYLSKQNPQFQYDVRQLISDDDIAATRNKIEDSNKQYALLAFAGIPIPISVQEYVKERYPKVVKTERYFNSEYILYEKGDQARLHTFKTHYLENSTSWKIIQEQLIDSSFYPGKDSLAFYMNQETEYACTYKDTIKNVFKGDFLTLSCWLNAKEQVEALLVVSIDRNGENIFWRGFNTAAYINVNEWSRFIQVIQIVDGIRAEDQISIYFWNNKKIELLIDEFEITNFADSDYHYYDFD